MPSTTPTTPRPGSQTPPPEAPDTGGARSRGGEQVNQPTRTIYPRSRTFGNAALTARQQFAWLWSRESVLRLVLSLVLAIALWLYVTSKQDPTQSWDFPQPVPVAHQSVAQGYMIANNIPDVHLRVRADTRTVPVTLSSFHAFIDLSNVRPGVHSVKVNVPADPGISVLSVTPSHIQVDLQRIATNHVPVRVHLMSRPPVGYQVGSARIDPSAVAVAGPQSVVSQVTQVVAYVSLTGQQSSIEGTYKVSAEDSVGRGVTGFLSLDPSLVNVQLPIIPLTSYKTLPVLVPLSGQARAGFGVVGVNVQPPDVTANGTPSTLNHISSLSTYPVSISNRGGGRFSTRVKLHLPRGVHVSQQYVTVTTQLGSVEASTSIETAVSVQNVANGLVAHTNVSSVLVTVVGPSSTLRHAAGRMRAVLDLTNDGIGTYQLTPKITTPAGLRIEGVYPSQVVVVLRPSASG